MPRRAPRQDPYVWIPGQGYDQAALSRLQRAFPRPAGPMGVFSMSGWERMFDDPFENPYKALWEIASGVACFGPTDEWTDWYHHLLAWLIPPSYDTHAEPLLEILISGFFTQHPDGPTNAAYSGFFDDALDTLGRSLMDRACWPDGEIDVAACLSPPNWGQPWCLSYASGKLSASMFFCLKYLALDDIAPWLMSVLSIPNIHWRAALIAWFVGAHGLLDGRIRQPSELQETAAPAIGWDFSYWLKGNYTGASTGKIPISDFLPGETRQAAIGAVRSAVTETVFMVWLASIARDERLAFELDDLPFRFWELYGQAGDRPS